MLNPAEQLGLPTPIPPKEYYQKYAEAGLKLLLSLAFSFVISFSGIPLQIGYGAWLASYVALVAVLYIKGVPVEFSIGNELSLCFTYFATTYAFHIAIDNISKLF